MWNHRRSTGTGFPPDNTFELRHASLPESALEPTPSINTISINSETPLVENGSGRQRNSVGSVPSSYAIGRSNSPTRHASIFDDEVIREEPFASTPESLNKWSSVARDREEKIQERRTRRAEEIRAAKEEERFHELYRGLLSLVDSKPPSRWDRFRLSKTSRPSDAPKTESVVPSRDDLTELAKHCYTPRFSTRALIFDFGDGQADYFDVEVGNVEAYWRSKPEWSLVRWIHIPFGRGVSHSSIEDIFLHDHPTRRPFTHAGEAVWPFLQTESLNFRSWYDFKRTRDVYLLLSEQEELRADLNRSTFESSYPGTYLQKDMEWRAGHIGTSLDFWSLVQSDMPFKLSEGGGLSEAMISNYQYCMMGPRDGLQELERDDDQIEDEDRHKVKDDEEIDEKRDKEFYASFQKFNKEQMEKDDKERSKMTPNPQETKRGHRKNRQALSKHPFFKGSQLVRNDFRAFHGDEYLLTMSAASGVDFLDTEFQHYLAISKKHRMRNPNATCIGRLMGRFEKTGCANWHRKTAEWLLVYIITEIGMAPNPFVMGMVAPTLGEAYQAVVLDLNRRRYDEWQRNETVQLVRDMLACGDELSVLVSVFGKRAKLFKGLLKDCSKMESSDLGFKKHAANAHSESSVQRVQLALRLAEEEFNCLSRLLSDVRGSLGALFHLRSIEQDELAKLADKQNKAVLVFTGVTIVFLPLSFFTSYFGMNLSDLTDNEKTQGYFWEVCGSLGVIIVGAVLLFASRHHFRWRKNLVWNQKQLQKQRLWNAV